MPLNLRPRSAPNALTALIVAGAVGAGLLPAVAGAAAPWSAATTIAGPAAPRLAPTWVEQGATVPHVSSGNAGPQVATWPTTSPVEGRGSQVIAAVGPTGVVKVRTSRTVVDSARYARDRVLHLVAAQRGSKVQLGYRLGTADLSSLGRLVTFGGPREIEHLPVMAVNASGAAVAAWHHATSAGDEIQLVIKPAGGRFGAIQTVKSTRVDERAPVGVGIDAGGRAVVAYVLQGPAQVAARVVDTQERRIHSASSITPAALADAAAPVQLAVGASQVARRQPIVVAWDAYRTSEDASPVSVGAATITAGGSRLAAVATLDAGSTSGYPRGPVLAAVDAAGRPVVAWSALPPVAPGGAFDQTKAPTVPFAAQADAAGRFGAPQPLDRDGTVGSIAATGAGIAIAYLREDTVGQPVAVSVALRGADLPFAQGEDVQSQPGPSAALPTASYPAGLQPPGLTTDSTGNLLTVFTDVAPADAALSTTQLARRAAP